jgi:hypothetical protein
LVNRIYWHRWLLFFAIAAYIVIGPFYRQVLDGESIVFRKWAMFSTFGMEVCDVRFTLITPTGERPVDRFNLLGYNHRRDAPSSLRRIEGSEEVYEIGDRLCRALPANFDLRLYGRCGSREGWQWIEQGEANLCLTAND